MSSASSRVFCPIAGFTYFRACLNREPSYYSSMVTFPSSAGAKGDLELPVYLSDKSAWDRIERRPRAGKVIYGFIFNHELDILEIALNTLGEVVDHFIILESRYTHFGDKKELHYHNSRERFKGFRDKIVHVVLDDKPSISQEEMTWEHEEYSRNCVGRAVAQIDGIDDDDLFIVVDADEIVDPRVVRFLSRRQGYPDILRLSFRHCYYGFYWEGAPCILSVATRVGFLRRNDYDANRIRRQSFDRNAYWQIGDETKWGGWHASWCLRPRDLRVKLLSSLKGDGERWGDHPEKTELGYLTNNISSGLWFSDIVKLHSTPRGTSYFAPDYVLANEEKFGYLISLNCAV